jgi:hypothetical protein
MGLVILLKFILLMSTVKARPMGLMKNKTFILVKYKEEV